MKKQDPYANQNNKHRNKLGRVTAKVYDVPENLRTQQQFKDECDINRIVKNAQKGIPPRFLARGEPHYGDFSRVPDLTEAYNITHRAAEAFMTLPAQLRLELDNDPANIVHLTKDQIDRYDLGKKLPATYAPGEDSVLSGGQPEGLEGAPASKPQKKPAVSADSPVGKTGPKTSGNSDG